MEDGRGFRERERCKAKVSRQKKGWRRRKGERVSRWWLKEGG